MPSARNSSGGKTLIVRYLTTGEVREDGTRTVFFELNGQPRDGPRPSETFELRNQRVVAEIAYPVSGLIVGLLKAHRRWSTSQRFPPTHP